MTESLKTEIERYFTRNKDQLLSDVFRIISIPSERGEAREGMPYGEGPFRALTCGSELMRAAGFKVENWDNRVITGDLTSLEPGLDILAHLDVVPCDKNWTVCRPYEPVCKDGRIYGRGTMDDKGPAIAALYAMKCVKELGVPLRKNVRLILGSDEECGCGDVGYYYSKNPEAPMTFSPDASFPLINLEKGRCFSEITGSFAPSAKKPAILSAKAGIKSNVVPDEAEAVISGFSLEAIKSLIEAAEEKTKARFFADETEEGLVIRCKGTSAHAMCPEAGNNALTAMLQFLVSLPCADSEQFRALKAVQSLFPHGDYHGKALGIAMSDEISGEMTASPDMLSLSSSGISIVCDARCPVCANDENTRQVIKAAVESRGLSLKDVPMVLPHYVDEKSDFVQTLLRVYEECTGLPGRAESTGGGTYVHDLKRGVAFGCETAGIDNCIHGANEFITEEQLLQAAKIFAHAIIELCA